MIHTSVCVKAVIFNKNKFLIVQRSLTDPIGPGDWEFPGGTVEFQETCEEALKREIYEETQLIIKSFKILYVSSFFIDNLKIFAITYYAVCNNTNVCLSSEHRAFKWVSIDEAKEIMNKNIIGDYLDYARE